MDDSEPYGGTFVETDRWRLPTLFEVLSRKTQSPVDLFAFYVYMRDQQRSVDYLDFWLDVSQHLELCRHFVSEMRRSNLFETPDLDRAGSKRSSQVLDNFEPVNNVGSNRERAPSHRSNLSQRTQDNEVSAYLRTDTASHRSGKGHTSGNESEDKSSASSHVSERPPRPSFMTSNFGDGSSPGDHSTPQRTVQRQDVRASAEKILYTYLLPGSEREIILPPATLHEITEAIEEQGRDDPKVFDAAKDYVFQAMERDAFPGFLRARALGNLVPTSLLLRLIVGLLAMFGGFWAAFALVFLNEDRPTRVWVLLPFIIGVYMLTSHQYTLDPVLAIFGFSELTLLSFVRVNEPFVKQLLRKRALIVSGWITIITVALVVLFVFVPGKRL